MKQFDLTNLGVQELNEQELLAVEGGNVLKKIGAAVAAAVKAVAEVAGEVWDWLCIQAQNAPEPDPWDYRW